MEPLYERTWSAADLHARYPVVFDDIDKARVFAAVDGDRAGVGEVTVSRWSASWPSEAASRPSGIRRRTVLGPFDYAGSDDRMVWYPNFADPDLFGYWDGPLLAQDELQVLEHPTLAAIRSALLAEGLSTATLDSARQPAPFLLQGLARVLDFDVMPCPARPGGLYGNRFRHASWDEIEGAITRLDPPTTTNLLALSAPYGGRGRYGLFEIRWILSAAYTAFAAAVARSGGKPVTLHTGFWGCGAFGGDPVLMTLAQWCAASAAGVDEVVMHSIDARGAQALVDAERLLGRVDVAGLDAAAEALEKLGRIWGVSDGN